MTLAGMALGLTACATNVPVGSIITNVTLPFEVTSNDGTASKVGESTCKSILAIISSGDCSIDAAKKNGGITKVHHADWHAKSILGIFSDYKLTVYGD